MPRIRLSNLTKSFQPDSLAVRDIDLTIRDRELLVLVGPSGSGKSTTLRLIAGLDRPTQGSIFFDDQNVTHWAAAQRRIGMVFQGENLFAHLDVRENLAIGLRLRGMSCVERERRVSATAQLLGLESYLDRWPESLSGGEQQRVALGRALTGQAPIYLLDEPLSNVDPSQRGELRAAIRTLHQQKNATLLHVTHDQLEAMTLGDRMAILHRGLLQQVGTPQEIYRRPANTFVAQFIGSPPMNLFSARVDANNLYLGSQVLANTKWPDGPIIAGIRPEELRLSQAGPICLKGVVESIEYLGGEQLVNLRQKGYAWIARLPSTIRYCTGRELELRCERENVYLFSADEQGRFLTMLDASAT